MAANFLDAWCEAAALFLREGPEQFLDKRRSGIAARPDQGFDSVLGLPTNGSPVVGRNDLPLDEQVQERAGDGTAGDS